MRQIFAVFMIAAVVMVVGVLPALAQGGIYYTVSGGETLAGIAAYYGVPTTTLAAVNNISNPNVLFAGQVLFIPTSAYTYTAPAATTTTFGTGGPTAIVAPRTPGVTQVTVPAVVQPAITQPVAPVLRPTYTVRTGDTLYGVAVSYGVTSESIALLNGITNLNNVRVGQVLVLPTSADAQIDYGTGGGGSVGWRTTHVVRYGDYMERIAAYYGVSVQAIALANGLQNPNVLTPGQVLRIP
jgi:LysM repeat protein